MARSRLLIAALAGLVVSFLVFVGLSLVTPDPDLVRGEGELRWERFQFASASQTFTSGSIVRVENDAAVPLDLIVVAPDGTQSQTVVPPGGTANVTLEDEGTYRFSSERYPWSESGIEVRSGNPFVRFFEDLADFELRARRSE